MSVSDKSLTVSTNNLLIAENQEKVFEAGQKSEYNRFWDNFQENGKRDGYAYAFAYWKDENFYPKHNITSSPSAERVFYNCKVTNLKQRLEECGVTLDLRTYNSSYCFYYCSSTEYPKLDISRNGNMGSMFYGCEMQKLELICGASTSFSSSTLSSCTNLTELMLEGVLKTNGLNVSSLKLTHDSLISIINTLYDYSTYTGTTTWKVTLGSTNLANLTDAEKAIATEKGWTLA